MGPTTTEKALLFRKLYFLNRRGRIITPEISIGQFLKGPEEGILMARRDAREIALQALYQIEVAGVGVEKAVAYAAENGEIGKIDDSTRRFAIDLVKGTLEHGSIIDESIRSRLKKWNIDRLGKVDRNILRIAAYEILFKGDIPSAVSINEAIEIAKKFSDDKSGQFINGVLDSLKGKGKDIGCVENDKVDE